MTICWTNAYIIAVDYGQAFAVVEVAESLG